MVISTQFLFDELLTDLPSQLVAVDAVGNFGRPRKPRVGNFGRVGLLHGDDPISLVGMFSEHKLALLSVPCLLVYTGLQPPLMSIKKHILFLWGKEFINKNYAVVIIRCSA